MPRQYLIDGYNLAFAWKPVRQKLLADKEAGRNCLLDMLARYKRISGAGITVVFDSRMTAATESPQQRSGIKVVFASRGCSADEKIYSLVSSAKDRGRLTVVSSDRQVAGFARRHGAQAMGSGEFSLLAEGSLKKSFSQKEKPEVGDVDRWLEIFGQKSDDR